MIVVDQEHLQAGRAAAAGGGGKFIDGLSSSDRVGIHVLPGAGPHIDFTANASARQGVAAAGRRRVRSDCRQCITSASARRSAIDRGDQFVLQEVASRECSGMSGPTLSQCQDSLPSEARMVVGAGARADAIVAVRVPRVCSTAWRCLRARRRCCWFRGTRRRPRDQPARMGG